MYVVYGQFSNFAAISWWKQVNFQWDDDEIHFVLDQHWNNSLQIDMSPHSDTLACFQVNQSLFFFLIAFA